MKNIITLILVFLLVGCTTQDQVRTTAEKDRGRTADQIRTRNRENLARLQIGMPKSEVLQVMGTETITIFFSEKHEFLDDQSKKGLDDRSKNFLEGMEFAIKSKGQQSINNPYRVETLKDKDGQMYEVLFYYTDLKKRDDVITDDELTPIVIKDGKLIGWGWTFLNDNVTKYQIDIR